ncbi:hypothetical protein [Pseudomonas triclosanedens]|uniref:Uncharacterized protein n=1 Tax=Pseudomonas triclosanedens TaxID=2961893 RepID=A0ABY7A3Q2_9PSED|nr:hypothetical protein [Pseudomonas triclosanedens]WAI51743.1 hypothetical protein OU419_10990 [Pseudomonas triclosanedens]
MKNLLAVIGLVVVVKKGYELYREYSELKREKEGRMSAASECPA